MYKAYRFRMYPNNDQIILINKNFGCVRFVYNYFLNKCKNNKYYKAFDMCRELKELYVEYPFLKEADSCSLRCSIFNLEDSSNEMTYTMDENDTLSNIALALFEDQTLADKAVNKIIKNNKEAIDKRLAEKNITDDKNIATEKGILTGITLNLSKVFEEVVKNNN